MVKRFFLSNGIRGNEKEEKNCGYADGHEFGLRV
jgi:hypothetical protein